MRGAGDAPTIWPCGLPRSGSFNLRIRLLMAGYGAMASSKGFLGATNAAQKCPLPSVVESSAKDWPPIGHQLQL
jgi:hypothetical protein